MGILGKTFSRAGGSRKQGMTPFKAGVIALVLIIVGSYFAYTRTNPFEDPYEFKAAFHTSNNLQVDAPVRIAGVEVGLVSKVEPLGDGADGSLVTMEIEDQGLPIHDDAQLEVRPRIFLEGNEFVDLRPGTPSAPVLEEGDTIPITQTAAPVQFGDVINVLDKDTRSDFRTIFEEYAFRGLNDSAREFNRSIPYWEDAYRNTAIASQALLGTEAGDLSRLIEGQQQTAEALAEQPEELQGLVSNFNTTAAAFAVQDDALQATIPALRDVLAVGEPALASLNSSFPGIQRFAVDALPGVRSSQVTIPETFPFIQQARGLFSRDELRGVAADLRRTIPPLTRVNARTIPLLGQGRQLSACTNDVLIPFARTPIPMGVPGPRPATGPGDHDPVEPDFEFLTQDAQAEPFMVQGPRSFVGLAGESRSSDANGKFFRVNFKLDNAATVLRAPGTEEAFSLPGIGQAIQLGGASERSRPAPPTMSEGENDQYRKPHFRPDFPCELSTTPDMRAPEVPPSEPLTSGASASAAGDPIEQIEALRESLQEQAGEGPEEEPAGPESTEPPPAGSSESVEPGAGEDATP